MWRACVSSLTVNVHHQEHLQPSVDDDDVIDEESSFPVVAVCSATWKIIDGAGVSVAPAVSQFAACRSGVAPFGGRMLSSASGELPASAAASRRPRLLLDIEQDRDPVHGLHGGAGGGRRRRRCRQPSRPGSRAT
jgi:hypothetical protein